MKKLELSKSNVDGKYILISTSNEPFFLSVEIFFSPVMTDFRDILYFYPEKKKSSLQETYFLYARRRRDVLCYHPWRAGGRRPPFFVRSISPRLY